MGHGDTLVIGDSNFPATSCAKAKNHINVRLDGQTATGILDDILTLFPLDTFVEKSVGIMDKVEKDKNMDCPIHREFIDIIKKHDSRGEKTVEFVERFDFYERTKDAYCVVSTTDDRSYGCIILKKGCV